MNFLRPIFREIDKTLQTVLIWCKQLGSDSKAKTTFVFHRSYGEDARSAQTKSAGHMPDSKYFSTSAFWKLQCLDAEAKCLLSFEVGDLSYCLHLTAKATENQFESRF